MVNYEVKDIIIVLLMSLLDAVESVRGFPFAVVNGT
jgi:hypothetical protein